MHEREMLMISTYPPRSCGVAIFSSDVVLGLRDTDIICRVIALEESSASREYGPEVWASLHTSSRAAHIAMGEKIQQSDAAIVGIQHEFGIFGGPDGEWIIDLVGQIRKPIFTTFHTVLPKPSANQRRILSEIAQASQRVIVLSEVAKTLLADVYDTTENVIVVAHGVPAMEQVPTREGKLRFNPSLVDRKIISTFGLMSRGKGLEYAIEALHAVAQSIPDVLYIIAGQTHPGVVETEGESYREELTALIHEYGLDKNVLFINTFLNLTDLLNVLAATDVYFTPYINPDQVVSGTLAYAIGAGKAILSTPYLYAKELLADGRGFLCEFRDSADMAGQLTHILSDTALREQTERRAYLLGRTMAWPNVSRQLAAIYTAHPATASSEEKLEA